MGYNVEIYATLLGRTGRGAAKWDKKFSVYVINSYHDRVRRECMVGEPIT